MPLDILSNASEEYSQAINHSPVNNERIHAALNNLFQHYTEFLDNNLFSKMNAQEREFINQFLDDFKPDNINALIPCMMNCAVIFYNLACYNFANNQLERAQIWCTLANKIPEEYLQFHKPLLDKLKETIIFAIEQNNEEPKNNDIRELQNLIKTLFKQISAARTTQEPDFFKKQKSQPAELIQLERMVNSLVSTPSPAVAKRIIDAIAALEISLKTKNTLNDVIKNTLNNIKDGLDRIVPINQYQASYKNRS
jgi:hypothetical protein